MFGFILANFMLDLILLLGFHPIFVYKAFFDPLKLKDLILVVKTEHIW